MMSRTITLAVAGAGTTNVAATVAVNLAIGFAALGRVVELHDCDPDRHASRALAGGEATRAAELLRVRRDGPLRLDATPPGPETHPAVAEVAVLACAPRLDGGSVARLRGASLVVVPVDGSSLSLRALDDVAGAVMDGARGRDASVAPLHVILCRRLPRSVDRWSLVERLSERADATLHPVTLPMGRAAPRDPATAARGRPRQATLYGPTTSAARTYAALARDLLRDLPAAVVQRTED